LWAFAGVATPVGVAKAADASEHLVDVESVLGGRRRLIIGGGWRRG
jgi:hypothetical protein